MTKVKLLYVDDDIHIQEFVKVLFRKMNIIDVTFASNGKEALEVYEKNKYDLVITDIAMPIMGGFELIEEIKKILPTQMFMMVTGLEERENLIKAIELRVNFFVEKPIDSGKFQKVFQDAMELINQKRELELSNLLLEQYKHAMDDSTILSK